MTSTVAGMGTAGTATMEADTSVATTSTATVADMVADMTADMMADMMADMVADMVAVSTTLQVSAMATVLLHPDTIIRSAVSALCERTWKSTRWRFSDGGLLWQHCQKSRVFYIGQKVC